MRVITRGLRFFELFFFLEVFLYIHVRARMHTHTCRHEKTDVVGPGVLGVFFYLVLSF